MLLSVPKQIGGEMGGGGLLPKYRTTSQTGKHGHLRDSAINALGVNVEGLTCSCDVSPH